MTQDYKNKVYIQATACHKEIPKIFIPTDERLKVESILDNYLDKRDKNESKLYKVLYEFRNGAVRGIVGAVILGARTNEIIAGGLVYGTISAFSKAFTQTYTTSKMIDDSKT